MPRRPLPTSSRMVGKMRPMALTSRVCSPAGTRGKANPASRSGKATRRRPPPPPSVSTTSAPAASVMLSAPPWWVRGLAAAAGKASARRCSGRRSSPPCPNPLPPPYAPGTTTRPLTVHPSPSAPAHSAQPASASRHSAASRAILGLRCPERASVGGRQGWKGGCKVGGKLGAGRREFPFPSALTCRTSLALSRAFSAHLAAHAPMAGSACGLQT